MKSLKKKICVSVFLDELFEEVECETPSSYMSNSSPYESQVVSANNCSSTPSGEMEERRPRPRKHRNAWRLSRREDAVFRDRLEELREWELWSRPVAEKVNRGTETHTEEEESEANDYDVDEYSDADLELELRQAEGDGVRNASREEGDIGKKDVALSAISITLSMKGEEGEVVVEEEDDEGAGLLRPPEESPRLNRSLYAIPEMVNSSRRANKALQTEEEEGGKGREDAVGEGLQEEEEAAEVARSKHCFLVARCAKSMDLTRKNNKSTQFDLSPEKGAGAKRRQAGETFNIGDQDRRMEEIYHHAGGSKSRKRADRPGNKDAISKVRAFAPRTTSETTVSRQHAEGPRLWHNVRHSKTWCNAIESNSANYQILKKGYCDVTVKTFVKANAEHFLCYSLSIPWEMTVFGEIIIPQGTLRSMKSHHEEKIFDDSLNVFRKTSADTAVLNESRLGTQCRVGLSPGEPAVALPAATEKESRPTEGAPQEDAESNLEKVDSGGSAFPEDETLTKSLGNPSVTTMEGTFLDNIGFDSREGSEVADSSRASSDGASRKTFLCEASTMAVALRNQSKSCPCGVESNKSLLGAEPPKEETPPVAEEAIPSPTPTEIVPTRGPRKPTGMSCVEVKVSETASSVSTEVSGFELVPSERQSKRGAVVEIVTLGKGKKESMGSVQEDVEAEKAGEERSLDLVLKPYAPFINKSVNTEPIARDDEDITVQWELEIEIHNTNNISKGEGLAGSGSRDDISSQSSKAQIIRAIEGPSETNVILVYDSSRGNIAAVSDGSVARSIDDIEQCYLKDDRIRKMYLANVPRRVLDITEEKLRSKSGASQDQG